MYSKPAQEEEEEEEEGRKEEDVIIYTVNEEDPRCDHATLVLETRTRRTSFLPETRPYRSMILYCCVK